ncbi:polysaccharide lyase [Arthrobacter sp. NicSoilB8]|uniref:polysaccharide lyase n=1 Tax=Arthrobacter sp. NicSoilB8 TaxID=2830998 RepID=UPI001CC4174A|nr:polysaccharide lyase [Arthrobacter sp. NicSoilB8]BCW72680.1 hypothetical protein NicSoilB8_37240 [Arthrobacter sp. NicSoilB8]
MIATNFEAGSLTTAGFAAPFTAGTGTADVSSAEQHSGRCSAHVHVTTDAGSVANFSAPLPAGSNEVYADGWFNVTKEGVAGNNVPYFRFFNGTTRFVDVYRSNGGAGPLWLRVAAPNGTLGYTPMNVNVPLGTWHHVVMHVIPNGASTTVEVWFDNKLVYSSKQVVTGFNAVTKMQLGAEHRRQAGDSYIDDVVIKAGKAGGQLPGTFNPIAPTRVLDTRNSSAVRANSAVSFQVAGVNGIPAKVAAVVFNLTVTQPRSIGFVTAYASGTARPNASNLNFSTGQTVPNLVTVPVGSDGKVTLFNSSSGSSQLIADVTGYYVTGTPSTAGSFKGIAPARLLDTRNSKAVGANSPVSFQVAGANGIPASVAAVVFNLTVTQAKSLGFVTAYASGSARPNASNLNFSAGQTVPNLVTVPVGSDGKVTLFNSSPGTSQLIADVAGYYLPGTPTVTGAFKAVGPTRILDTRNTKTVAANSAVSFQVAGANGVPTGALGAVFNLTVTSPKSFGFITAYPSGSGLPNASNLNFATGQTVPNLVSVPLGSDGKVTLSNQSKGAAQLIADLAGYFLP